ncbi:MAG: hypothetical protein AB1546_03020, partial [bacterium]
NWFDNESVICVLNEIKKIHYTYDELQDFKRKDLEKPQTFYNIIITKGIYRYSIDGTRTKKLIDASFLGEEILCPFRFGKIIVFLNLENQGMFIYDMGKRETKRIGYNVSVNETVPTQDGRLFVKFAGPPETTNIPTTGNFFARMRTAIFSRKADALIVDPAKIKTPLR